MTGGKTLFTRFTRTAPPPPKAKGRAGTTILCQCRLHILQSETKNLAKGFLGWLSDELLFLPFFSWIQLGVV
jgi:hypothetical protein